MLNDDNQLAFIDSTVAGTFALQANSFKPDLNASPRMLGDGSRYMLEKCTLLQMFLSDLKEAGVCFIAHVATSPSSAYHLVFALC